jgi:hypothetical protein
MGRFTSLGELNILLGFLRLFHLLLKEKQKSRFNLNYPMKSLFKLFG